MNYHDARDLSGEITATWKLGPTTQVWLSFLQHEVLHTDVAKRAIANLRRQPHTSMDTGTLFVEYTRLLKLREVAQPVQLEYTGEPIHPRLGRQIAYSAYHRAGGNMPRRQFMQSLGAVTN